MANPTGGDPYRPVVPQPGALAPSRVISFRVENRDAIERLAERKDDTPDVHAQIPCDIETR